MANFPMTWVVVADSARARLFEWASLKSELTELADFTNSEGRLREQSLTSDRPGMAFGSQGHSRRRMQTPKSEVDNTTTAFAHDLAGVLKAELEQHHYERLVLLAPPKFLGQLRSQLDAQVSKRVVESDSVDLTKEDRETIESHLPRLSIYA
jgi:protein required for attachment to host cells